MCLTGWVRPAGHLLPLTLIHDGPGRLDGGHTISVLITGAAGFIGTALTSRLLETDLTEQLVLVDSMHPQVHGGNAPGPALSALDGVTFHRSDICDPATWDSILAAVSPRVIIHLAGETGTGQSLTLASRHTQVNVNGVAAMLDGLVRAKSTPEAIIVTSSRAVYGEGRWRGQDGQAFYPGPRSRAQLEAHRWAPIAADGSAATFLAHEAQSTEPRPTSIYAATKLAQEHVLAAWCAAFGTALTTLRLQNVYGPGQSIGNAYTGVLTYFARQVCTGERLNVYESGGIVRDFVHVSDAVEALVSSLSQPPRTTANGTATRLIDIGSGHPVTLLECAEQLSAAANGPGVFVSDDFRDGDVRAAFADISAAAADLQYTPRVPFSEGAAQLLDWVGAEILRAEV